MSGKKLKIGILIIGIIFLITGIVFNNLAKNMSTGQGGDYIIAKSFDGKYYIPSVEKGDIEISRDAYIKQNALGITSSIGLLLGGLMMFIFFMKLFFYMIRNPSKFK